MPLPLYANYFNALDPRPQASGSAKSVFSLASPAEFSRGMSEKRTKEEAPLTPLVMSIASGSLVYRFVVQMLDHANSLGKFGGLSMNTAD